MSISIPFLSPLGGLPEQASMQLQIYAETEATSRARSSPQIILFEELTSNMLGVGSSGYRSLGSLVLVTCRLRGLSEDSLPIILFCFDAY